MNFQPYEMVSIAIQVILVIGFFLAIKFLPANTVAKASEIIALLTSWADRFVRYARQFLSGKSGEEKMETVVDLLQETAQKLKLNLTKEQLEAIAQEAYERMKKEADETNKDDSK